MVVDGGTKESGEAIVEHIKKYYGRDYVDYVVNTHPDADHASGLSVVLENLNVGELWMHRPWLYAGSIRELFSDGRITDNSLAERIKSALNAAKNIEEIAENRGIRIYEPFEGEKIGCFTVLSPNKDWYLSLLPDFRSTPEVKEDGTSFLAQASMLIKTVIEWVQESFEYETLSENGETSAENESSVVLHTYFNEDGFLLTGDAGIKALSRAADFFSASCDEEICEKIKFIQVPHHGSRKKVSPSILNRIVGPILDSEEKKISAFVSVAKNAEKHPYKVVTNAFCRRGAPVVPTEGKTIRNYRNTDPREGWSICTPIPFQDEVENDERESFSA